MKRLAILGSTGSIGTSTLRVVDAHPGRFRIAALGAGRSLDRLTEQVLRYRPEVVVWGAKRARDRSGIGSGASPRW